MTRRSSFLSGALLVVSLTGIVAFATEDARLAAYRSVAAQLSSYVTGYVTPSPSPSETVRVKRVIDGDTFELENGDRVRYIGVNAPESVAPGRPVECFGREASAYDKALVEGRDVRLEKDVSERDKYGRLLRYVYVGETLVNAKLVEEGYASADAFPPDVRYRDLFRALEREARDGKRGLWADTACAGKK